MSFFISCPSQWYFHINIISVSWVQKRNSWALKITFLSSTDDLLDHQCWTGRSKCIFNRIFTQKEWQDIFCGCAVRCMFLRTVERWWEAVVRCVCGMPVLRIKGVMFSLRQLKMVAAFGTWDPCLSAGIGVEPAASVRARCCFIYLRAQVTFLEECSREICLRGLSVPPSSVTHLAVKDKIERHKPSFSPECHKAKARLIFSFC